MVTERASKIFAGESEQTSILVVEDDVFVRWAISEELRGAGYLVIEAASGGEAITIIQTGVKLHLVFSDVQMPGSIDGLALLDFISRSNPSIPVLMTSGHYAPEIALKRGAVNFVRKPYEIEGVLSIVKSELAQVA